MRRIRRWSAAAIAAGACLVLTPQVSAAPPTPAGIGGEPGTIDTLAGPGFCDGPARVDPSSIAVTAVTVDRTGTVSALAGTAGQGLIAQVGGPGGDQTFPLLGAFGNGPPDRESALVAADGSGGLFFSQGTRIAHLGAVLPADDPTLSATFIGMRALATDEAGNVYVADEIEEGAPTLAIRFVNRGEEPLTFYGGTAWELTVGPKAVATIAGTVGDLDGGDARPATEATISGAPISMAVSGERLYLGVYGSTPGAAAPQGRVRAINLGAEPLVAHGTDVDPGMIQTVAGGSPTRDNGEGPAAGYANLGAVPGVATDGKGNLFLAEEDRHRVHRVDPEGGIATVAGTDGQGGEGGGFNGNDQPATRAQLNRPVDVEVGAGGVLYIADRGNGQVRAVDGAGNIRAVVGAGLAMRWNCDGAPTPDGAATAGRPLPSTPGSAVADGRGAVYFVASGVARVMRLDAAGTVTPVTESSPSCESAPCPSALPRVARPTSLALGPHGDLYILDGGDNRVLVLNLGDDFLTAHGVTLSPGALGPVAGNGTVGDDGDGGRATAAQLSAPGSLAVDAKGNLFIADTGNGAVRQVDAAGTIRALLPQVGPSDLDCCFRPTQVALGPAGNLYVVEAGSQVWLLNRGPAEITAHGQAVAPGAATLVAGSGGYGFGGDGGPALGADFQAITGIAADQGGNLYIADQPSSTVRRVDAAGLITTVAGVGSPGFNGDGLKAQLTRLLRPSAVALDRCGNLLIADSGNDRLRRLNLTPTCPPLAVSDAPDGGLSPAWALAPLVGGAVAVLAVAVWRRRSRSKPGPAEPAVSSPSAAPASR